MNRVPQNSKHSRSERNPTAWVYGAVFDSQGTVEEKTQLASFIWKVTQWFQWWKKIKRIVPYSVYFMHLLQNHTV